MSSHSEEVSIQSVSLVQADKPKLPAGLRRCSKFETRTSHAWKFVKTLDDISFYCDNCSRKITPPKDNQSTNIGKHLKKCYRLPDVESIAAKYWNQSGPTSNVTSIPTPSVKTTAPIINSTDSMPDIRKAMRLAEAASKEAAAVASNQTFTFTSEEIAHLEVLLAMVFIQNAWSINSIESEALCQLIHACSRGGWHLPGRTTLTRLIDDLSSKVVDAVKKDLESSPLSITSDGGLLQDRHSYQAYTCHYVKRSEYVLDGEQKVKFEQREATLAAEPHHSSATGEYLTKTTQTVMQRYVGNRVAVAACTDSCSTMLKAIRDSDCIESSLQCVNHIINNSLKDAAKDDRDLTELNTSLDSIIQPNTSANAAHPIALVPTNPFAADLDDEANELNGIEYPVEDEDTDIEDEDENLDMYDSDDDVALGDLFSRASDDDVPLGDLFTRASAQAAVIQAASVVDQADQASSSQSQAAALPQAASQPRAVLIAPTDDSTEWYEYLMKKANRLVAKFGKAEKFRRRLRNAQRKLHKKKRRDENLPNNHYLPLYSLESYVDTRFLAMHFVWKRLLKLRDAIDIVTKEDDYSQYRLTDDEWKRMADFVQVMKEINEVSVELEGSKVSTIGLMSAKLVILYDTLQQQRTTQLTTDTGKVFSLAFELSLRSRVGDMLSSHLYRLSYALDPRVTSLVLPGWDSATCHQELEDAFETFDFHKYVDESVAPLQQCPVRDSSADLPVNNNSEPSSKRRKLNFFQKQKDQTKVETEVTKYLKYLEDHPMKDPDNECPFEWWSDHVAKFPKLAQMAQTYLAIPCSSAASERVFSTARLILDYKRRRLNPDRVSALICLKRNLSLYINIKLGKAAWQHARHRPGKPFIAWKRSVL